MQVLHVVFAQVVGCACFPIVEVEYYNCIAGTAHLLMFVFHAPLGRRLAPRLAPGFVRSCEDYAERAISRVIGWDSVNHKNKVPDTKFANIVNAATDACRTGSEFVFWGNSGRGG